MNRVPELSALRTDISELIRRAEHSLGVNGAKAVTLPMLAAYQEVIRLGRETPSRGWTPRSELLACIPVLLRRCQFRLAWRCIREVLRGDEQKQNMALDAVLLHEEAERRADVRQDL